MIQALLVAAQRYPLELSPARRAAIVAVSALFLAGMLICAGRKIRRAFRDRDKGEDRYPDELP